ncbi:hypothetical protein KY326_03305 [Candidatus Woesearchaeota archaeon]|nr:hypothetical protein [Candidatus Woesearchaeota archaeon]
MKKGWYRRTLFYTGVIKAKENPKLIGLILLFDLLFLFSAFLLQNLFNVFIPKSVVEIVQVFGAFIMVFAFGYYLILLFLYSFFGYIILHFIKSLVKKEKFTFRYLGKYFLLNLFIFVLGLICMIAINLGLKAVRAEFLKIYTAVTLIPFLILFLIFIFIAHAAFIEEKIIRKVIRKSFQIMFADPKRYFGFILGDAVILIILAVLLLIFWLVGIILGGSAEQIFRYLLSGIFIVIFVYVLLILNRIMFYLAVIKKK